MKQYFFLICFLIAVIVCLIGRLVEDPLSAYLDYISIPLLMPLLFLYFRDNTHSLNLKEALFKFISMGLLFAWLGDLFLMISKGSLNLFICGLLCFLVMQLLYIRLFMHNSNSRSNLFKARPFLAIPSILTGLGFYILLFPELGLVLRLAVGIYSIALVGMTLGAINRYKKCNIVSFWLVTIGAFSFMFSDMMIGLNSFVFAPDGFLLAGFWIMITYTIGQLLIIQGLIVHFKYEKNIQM